MTWSPEYGHLDFQTLQGHYRAGELKPVDVIDAVYDRLAARGDDHVWIHLVSREHALERARGLHEQPRGRLYGLPFAIKDNIDLADTPTTAACPDFAYLPKASATVVRKLVDAGAIPIGKTNLDQFATGLVGVRSPYGACANVFDKRYIAGGSSSGSAVAVAAGEVSFALGTDAAGSGLVPAAFNGIFGLKPTRGLLSTAGVVPTRRSLDCVSIFTTTSEDARVVWDVAKGFDTRDAYSRREADLSPQSSGGSNFRFGVPSAQSLEFFGDTQAECLFSEAIEQLERIGGTCVEIDFMPFGQAGKLLDECPWSAERLASLQEFYDSNPQSFFPVTRQIIGGAGKSSAVDAFRGMYKLAELRRQTEFEWARMAVLVVPTTGTIYTLAEVEHSPIDLNRNLGRYTNFVNLLDLCAIAVPAGFRPNGLPFGVTLIGPAFQDAMLCALGSAYQRGASE